MASVGPDYGRSSLETEFRFDLIVYGELCLVIYESNILNFLVFIFERERERERESEHEQGWGRETGRHRI